MSLRQFLLLFLFSITCSASITIQDPSDYADLSADASDNAIKAIYNIQPTFYQLSDIVAPYSYSGKTGTISHNTLSIDANDTSVIVIANKSNITLSHLLVEKSGYASNLYQSSFYGTNAAINIANASTSHISASNITVHNGAANVYAFGTGTFVSVTNTNLYSSGPVSHGLYASGNATIKGSNIKHYSGGNRCSSFSGDSPAGYIYVENSIAHTAGIGSAIFYALGEIHADNVYGYAEKAPVLFSDGTQKSVLKNCDLRSGFLAGVVMFSSMTRQTGAVLKLEDTKLVAEKGAGLWFGNIVANVEIKNSEILADSGTLVLANRSQVTQEFSFFAGSEENSGIQAAVVEVLVSESKLKGDIVAMNGSEIFWNLRSYSSWTGAAVVGSKGGQFAVTLDKTSMWSLTADVVLANFTNADQECKNIQSNGFSIRYAAKSGANAWLGGRTRKLPGGGSVKPY